LSKQSVTKDKIKAVILAGSRDFGRYPLASRWPTALWPVAGKSVLERLLNHLADQGIEHVVVCSCGEGSLLADSVHADDRLKLTFLDESLPAGTAGCIRDAVSDATDALLLVFPASLMCPPEIDVLISAHRDGESDLTIMLNPGRGNSVETGQASGIYVCSHGLLEQIPKAGYSDIKEGLIPEMLRTGKTVHAARLPKHAGNFRDRQGYLYALANCLQEAPKLSADLKPCKGSDSQAVWMAANARIDPAARIYGPAVIMDGVTVSSGAVILGPTILGKDVTVGQDSVVADSVIWPGARVGPNCRIQRCIIDSHAAVRANAVVEEESVTFEPKGMLERSVGGVLEVAKNYANSSRRALEPQLGKISERIPQWARLSRKGTFTLLASGFVLLAFLWSHWHGLVELWSLWQRSDEYSSGLLVPFLTVYVLWSRRRDLARCSVKPCLWGVFVFVAAQALRFFGLFFMYGSATRLSIALTIGALVLLLFGWQLVRKVATVLLFLCLMLPWPNQVQAAVAQPLQRWATSSAVFCLEAAGYDVIQEGNVIRIGYEVMTEGNMVDLEWTSVAVAEACNGLRMVTAFFVISGLVVLLVKRAWWEKMIILASSLPIALLCNTVRLSITAVFFTVLEGEQWEKIFHDFGGYAMMPLALAAIVGELWLLAKLTTLPDQTPAKIITRQSA
jgi:exosortase